MENEVTFERLDEKTWKFDNGGVYFFLLAGNERALLIDSGMHAKNAKELAESLTDLPISLLNTHADMDHISGNGGFETFYMHPAEATNYYNTGKRTETFLPVWDGDQIDLGDRELQIIHTPGHTPGSIAVLDKKHRRLFSGDPVQDGEIFMFGIHREMRSFRYSLKRLMDMSDQFDELYPCHGTCPVKPSLIKELYDAAGSVMEGRIPGTPGEMFGHPVTIYDVGCAKILCDPEE